jgi:hypothetical protein
MKLMAALLATLLAATAAQTPEGPFHVAHINYFGAWGYDASKLTASLPIHAGDPIRFEDADPLREKLAGVITHAYGTGPTDVTYMCCDTPGAIEIYIGLAGDSYRPLAMHTAPRGTSALPREATQLMRQMDVAWTKAVQRNAREDDTKGYALMSDPTLRAVELQMRAFALAHPRVIESVLKDSAASQQRRDAAMLLGYTQHSREQVDRLIAAMHDPDDEVRNNALRALMVLAHAHMLRDLPVDDLVPFLYSGEWTDRNKASLLLEAITEAPTDATLRNLRRTALPALLDGATWDSLGHAAPFLVVLERIEGLSGEDMQRLADASTQAKIVQTARAMLAQQAR